MKNLPNDKKNIFCMFTTSNDINFLINRYEHIINKFISIHKSFVIFKFTKKNKIKSKLIKSSKIRNCKIVEIRNQQQFYDYTKNKILFAIDEIDRGLKFYNIRRLINRNNIKLIFIMNLGHISNHKFISERGITLRNRFYYLIKYIENFL